MTRTRAPAPHDECADRKHRHLARKQAGHRPELHETTKHWVQFLTADPKDKQSCDDINRLQTKEDLEEPGQITRLSRGNGNAISCLTVHVEMIG